MAKYEVHKIASGKERKCWHCGKTIPALCESIRIIRASEITDLPVYTRYWCMSCEADNQKEERS